MSDTPLINALYIFHHLGLGDHLICNGLVRYLLKTKSPDHINLAVKARNLSNVERMYRDESRIRFIVADEPNDFLRSIDGNAELIRIGFENCNHSEFDVGFYHQIGVDFSVRWSHWYCERDYKQEFKVLEELNLPEDFVLVNDSCSGGRYDLNVQSEMPIVYFSKLQSETSIFDWTAVIEKAKEIHTVDSSFLHLVNSIEHTTDRLFYHNVRPPFYKIRLTPNWTVLEA